MARKEQIDAWVKEKYPDTGLGIVCRDTAREAIQWADKTMIDKVVKILEETLYDKVCYGEIRSDIVEQYISDFKKAISV